jgi:hypothetical protein
MANTYELIQSYTVPNTTTYGVTIGSGGTIPQTYTDLVLQINGRTNRNNINDDLMVRINGVTTGTIYGNRRLYVNGTSSGNDGQTGVDTPYAGSVAAGTATANAFSICTYYFPSYSGSLNKVMNGKGSGTNIGGDLSHTMAYWTANTTSAITSITVSPFNGTYWIQGSNFYLYGIKNS